MIPGQETKFLIATRCKKKINVFHFLLIRDMHHHQTAQDTRAAALPRHFNPQQNKEEVWPREPWAA